MLAKTAHKRRPGRGLRTKDISLAFVLVAVLLSSVSLSNAYAGQGKASGVLIVTATIEPYANLKVISQAHEVIITEADIRQGYVDVNSASLFQIKSNSTRGYTLAFESAGTTFKEVRVEGPGINTVLTNGTGLVFQPYSRGTATLELSYRFTLPGNISPGAYAWPLAVSVSPIR